MSIRVKSIRIHNVGLIADETIELNLPLIVLYGQIKMGKSTCLNAVRWVLGGSYPSDLIKHGETEAEIVLTFEGGTISRSWYIDKAGVVKARDVAFVRNGRQVPSPVAALKALANPFLLNQNHLVDMSEPERKRFFADILGVDTVALDTEATTLDDEAKKLRAVVDSYGDIKLELVEKVDVEALKTQRKSIVDAHTASMAALRNDRQTKWGEYVKAVADRKTATDDLDKHNNNVSVVREKYGQTVQEISMIESKLAILKSENESRAKWLKDNPSKDYPAPLEVFNSIDIDLKLQAQPNTADLDSKLQQAEANNVRHEQYLKDLARAEKKQKDEQRLSDIADRKKQIARAKSAKLSDISESCGIKDISFDINGEFVFQGTSAAMLSTSQLMTLSSQLSSLYPEGVGLGVELIDRAESLGDSIFTFVDRAREKNLTILATVVGERPAKAPPEVGVFVVKDGKISSGEQKELL